MSIVDSKVQGITVTNAEGKGTVKFEAPDIPNKHVAVQGEVAWVLEGEQAASVYYYEVLVKSLAQEDTAVGVGLAREKFPTTEVMPGWLANSYAYHGDDGGRFAGAGRGEGGWPTFGKNEVAGIGLKVSTGEIFGTLNGKFLGLIAKNDTKEPLYPTIGFNDSAEVEVLFDKAHHKYDITTLPAEIVPSFGSLEETSRVSKKLLVLFTNGVDDAQRGQVEDQLKAASAPAKAKYGYQSFHTKETENKAKAFREFVGIPDRAPLLVAINLENSTKYAIPEGQPITTESIAQFIEDIDTGKVKSLMKSAPRPPNDQHPHCPTLTQVVGSSFDEIVLKGTKDVLLDVYADWCGPCRAIAPTLEILSQVFADNDNIVIAKIDCDANDYDTTYLPETSIPNIKLFGGTKKTEPIKYAGNRSLENFITFLHSNASIPFDLQAALDKGKELNKDLQKKLLKNVIPIHKAEDFDAQIAGDKLVIVDYFATWCGPCKAIAPKYADLSVEFSNAVFLKVDVDELQEVSKAQGISCMPTFKAYKKGVEVGKLEGADPNALKKLVVDNL